MGNDFTRRRHFQMVSLAVTVFALIFFFSFQFQLAVLTGTFRRVQTNKYVLGDQRSDLA